jgi:hypothetical protein
MCTMIAGTRPIRGAGKGSGGWFAVNQATVAYDHASHTPADHALLLDFVNYEIGPSARVALELDLASGRALLEQLQATIMAAEASGVTESLAG